MYPKIPFDPSVQICSNPALTDLEAFKSGLEKIFFADPEVQLVASRNRDSQLVITLKCGLRLTELICSQRNGFWGPSNPAIPGDASVSDLLKDLREANPGESLDIEELNLELVDTLIVIRSIGPDSIVRELPQILIRLGDHYPYFAGNLQTTPFEIFISVSDTGEPDCPSAGWPQALSFYAYWALYFDSEEEAFIYDLRRRHLLMEDLGLGIPE